MAWFPKKCVVVPVDFSHASDIAVRTVLWLVESPKQVHVVNVVTIPQFIPNGEFVWVVEPEGWTEKAAEHLGKYIVAHPEFSGVTFATVPRWSAVCVLPGSAKLHSKFMSGGIFVSLCPFCEAND